MKKEIMVLAIIMLVGGMYFGLQATPEPGQANNAGVFIEKDKIGLKIFYAGHPGTVREKDFVEFLGEHFYKVRTGDLAEFDGSQSEGFDVTILDYDGDGFKSPRPTISVDFSRPLLTMGVTGAHICSRSRLAPKLDYL